jgi:hypothetical protein
MASLLQLALDRLVAVELAVHHDLQASVLVRDRLIAGREVDDGEARVAEPDPAMRRDPPALRVGAAMLEPKRRPAKRVLVDRVPRGDDGHDAAHSAPTRYAAANRPVKSRS